MSNNESQKQNKNKINFLGIIAIGMTTVIGSGIWRDPLKWANSSGIFSILAVVISWLLFLTAGLSYAECVSMFPKSGGPYSYVGGAVNKKWGTLVGILYYIGYLFISSLLAFLTANFTLGIFGVQDNLMLVVFTLLFLILFGLLSGIVSPRLFGFLALGWVLIKIVFLIIVSILMLLNADVANYSVNELTFSGFQETINLSIWALLGFEVMLIFTEELNKKDSLIKGNLKMSIGILIALLSILGVYILVTLGASSLVGINDLGTSNPFVIIASNTGIPTPILSFFAAFSAAGTCFAVLATCIHQLRVMARDDSLPKIFNKTKKGYHIANIGVTIILVVIIGSIMTLLIPLTEGLIVDIFAATGIGIVLISAMLPAGIIALYLRIKMPILERPFKTKFYYIVFPLAILLSIFLFYLNIIQFF
ncbi:MAG: APC family permease [Promethearchaeota archaeon]|nr:MAG: APC family permease [Candidatus Lokiarchaeota archaeon]